LRPSGPGSGEGRRLLIFVAVAPNLCCCQKRKYPTGYNNVDGITEKVNTFSAPGCVFTILHFLHDLGTGPIS